MSSQGTGSQQSMPLEFNEVLAGNHLRTNDRYVFSVSSHVASARHLRRGRFRRSATVTGISGRGMTETAGARNADTSAREHPNTSAPRPKKGRDSHTPVRNFSSMSIRRDPRYLRKRRIALDLKIAAIIAGPALVLLPIFVL